MAAAHERTGWVSRPEPDRFWLRFGYLERVL